MKDLIDKIATVQRLDIHEGDILLVRVCVDGLGNMGARALLSAVEKRLGEELKCKMLVVPDDITITKINGKWFTDAQ